MKAYDHDFHPTALVTPVGIFLPEFADFFIYHATSKVTSDCLVDVIESFWESNKARFPEVTELVINLDNGPECHSRRTQFMKRMVEFARQTGLTIYLTYYPPYHSKYNAVERCWGILELHWNGSILDTLEAVVRCSETMTWKGNFPIVELVTKTYETGVKLSKDAMDALELEIERLPGLGKWFVKITGKKSESSTL